MSRRGLSAAGLAVAVVGSLGIISIVKAGADEVPTEPAAVTSSAGTDDEVSPPPLLPWGSEPEKLDTAKAGTSSEKLGDTGADAAPQDAANPTELEPETAPKGGSDSDGMIDTTKAPVPPMPPARRAPAPGSKVNFYYGVGSQEAVTDGAYANLVISKPWVDKRDAHSLAEISVEYGDAQKVEFGWNVDRTIYGDDDPHMFVFHWVDNKPTCYNGCGFVQYSGTVGPGAILPEGQSKNFGIRFFDGAWWVAYASEWIGYFPTELWDGNFTKSDYVQFFGEVAAATTQPCTRMGDGLAADDPTAARIGSIAYINGPPLRLNLRSTQQSLYTVEKLSDRTFRYGGIGAKDSKGNSVC